MAANQLCLLYIYMWTITERKCVKIAETQTKSPPIFRLFHPKTTVYRASATVLQRSYKSGTLSRTRSRLLYLQVFPPKRRTPKCWSRNEFWKPKVIPKNVPSKWAIQRRTDKTQRLKKWLKNPKNSTVIQKTFYSFPIRFVLITRIKKFLS